MLPVSGVSVVRPGIREMTDMTLDPPGPDPTIHRRRLRNELRRARESAQRTQKDVTAAMDWSVSKLIRIESGTVNISTNDLRALLGFYDVPQERMTALVQLAKAAREVTQWAPWRNVVSPEYLAFLGYESSAAIIRNFEPMLVPGLVQTEEYAHEVIRAIEPQDKVESLVDLRMQRQELLVRPNPPKLHLLLDEAVIRRKVGGADVMRRQIRRILEVAQEPHVTVRVVAFDQGMYPRLRVPYVLFEFEADEDEDVLYVENPLGEFIIRENSPEERGPVTPPNYLNYFWEIEQIARSSDAAGVLQAAMDSFS
jgi:transcriptional regulator with XRE-family HTH domain